MKPRLVEPASVLEAVEADLAALLAEGRPIRRDLTDGGRLHIDRPLPFLCVHVGLEQSAAFDTASANAAYLIASDARTAGEIAALVASRMQHECPAFLVLDVGELEEDRFLTDDTPFLPPFEIALASGSSPAEEAALKRFAKASAGREAKYRTPRIEQLSENSGDASRVAPNLGGLPTLTVRFAPIYRVPGSERVYPALRDSVIANMLDSGLQSVSAFLDASKVKAPVTHRSLGRRAFVDAVTRADRALDKVATAFDFLLAVTPINAAQAWLEFEAGNFERQPTFLYRPLEFEVPDEKRKLYAIALDHLEDPLLAELFSEKQQELDLQLSMIAARETPRFAAFGRALYGGIEPSLLASAKDILGRTGAAARDGQKRTMLDCNAVTSAARDMVAGYRTAYPDFDAVVEIRADVPAGLLVSGNRLLVSRDTRISPDRLTALLSHEIGVHLLTYFNGSAQGLAIFRSGLAGYEGMQEGLAVLAEFLVGGMTVPRLRLIAARVLACEAMLAGAPLPDTFRLLHKDLGFDGRNAFNVVLRVYRGGGFAKDAIYLRGVLQVLNHLKGGGTLTPFWMGKISAAHFGAIQELRSRGLLRAPRVEPVFLSSETTKPRLRRAMAGLEPIHMLTD